jgi:hypothetical protein
MSALVTEQWAAVNRTRLAHRRVLCRQPRLLLLMGCVVVWMRTGSYGLHNSAVVSGEAIVTFGDAPQAFGNGAVSVVLR